MKKHSQRGISSLGLLAILAIGGFVLLAAFRLGPLYIDNYFVSSALDSLADEKIHEMSDGQIRRKLANYFVVNNVRDIDTRDIEIERERTHTLVKVDYEKRVDFLANVDVVVEFKNHFNSSQY